MNHTPNLLLTLFLTLIRGLFGQARYIHTNTQIGDYQLSTNIIDTDSGDKYLVTITKVV